MHHTTDRSKLGRERMLTEFVSGPLGPLAAGVLATGRTVATGKESVATLPTSAVPSPPAASGIFKALLISALSRMHLWPGGSPDYIVNGTSCFLNQEQRPYNDNPEHHSNTIGRY